MDLMEKRVRIVRECMPLKAGFTLMEIAIGLAILGIASSIVIPSFQRQIVRYEQNKCFSTLDTFIAQAWINTLKTGKIHRIKVNLKSGNISIEMQKENDQGQLEYEKIPSLFSTADFYLPLYYHIINFYIDGVDECAQHGAGRSMEDVWFFVYPRGYTQSVIINISNEREQEAREIGLVLNPFRIQFEVYDGFQKP
jgi:prepilin-type N-terminal cleavage/methylation domain-containing protein